MRDHVPKILLPLRLLAALAALMLAALPALAQDGAAMRRALALAAQGDWGKAAGVAPGAIGQDIVAWQRLRAGEGTLADYEAFLARRPDWPGLALLRAKGEEAVAEAAPERVTAYFDGRSPATAPGAVALVGALLDLGQTEAAAGVAAKAWTELPFGPQAQADLLALLPETLAPLHWTRLDRLLWEGEAAEARRMLPLVGPDRRRLAEARLALRAEAAGVDSRVAAVPPALAGDPGLAWERFLWRARKGREADALELILARSTGAESLGRPDVWADRRAAMARALMRDGEARTAYRLASGHFLTGGADYADLEFLSGFLALRKLDDAEAALGHFRRLRAAVTTPISLARAAYWEGRAMEELGRAEDARAAFAYAAEFQTAFYGLLAAERLDLPLDPDLLAGAEHPDWRQSAFAGGSVLEAALLLHAAGDRALAKRFFLHLAEGLDATGLGQLGDLALALDEPHIAVLIAKQAAERGVILPRAYFPVTDLVPDGLAVSRALGLSIARRESEFDPVVVSPAGARGLMQVMPETARMMAGRIGKPYDRARLTSDPAYNAALGTAYLDLLIEEFGPSIALVAAGYNAGPGRPRAWVSAFGDPRREGVDVVDWIETIPFTETRTYIMRVAESLVIYRARLKGEAGPVRITAELRG
jgi:soluble lytic murein transglycosylase